MSYQITLQLEDVAGALARVMSCLRKLGLGVVGQSFEVLPEGGRNLVLDVDGPVLNDEQLRTPLEALNGVARLLTGSREAATEPVAVENKAPVDVPDTRYKDKDSEAGDAEIRDRMLIFTLLSRYPKISGKLLELHTSIPEAERSKRMLELGQGFGGYLYKNLKIKGVVSELRAAIELAIVPALSPLVQVSQYSEGVRVSGFSKNMKHAAEKPECCQFLAGTIQGLLDSADELPSYRVEQVQCIHQGAHACEYKLSPA
ncbi:hypothetical protein [Sedimenticola sp.]|uniref:hypothetical protein n=1 Tax=Sedimenticola sp. TaxID=1940285 RepID=UPI003D0D4A90